jgi:hypothetical protein
MEAVIGLGEASHKWCSTQVCDVLFFACGQKSVLRAHARAGSPWHFGRGRWALGRTEVRPTGCCDRLKACPTKKACLAVGGLGTFGRQSPAGQQNIMMGPTDVTVRQRAASLFYAPNRPFWGTIGALDSHAQRHSLKRHLTRQGIRRHPGNRCYAAFDKRWTGPFYRFCPLLGSRRGPV